MFQRKLLHTLFFVATFLLVSCQQQSEQQDESIEPIRSEYKLEAPEMDREARQLQLAGGSERDVREPNPVSNNILQQKYPDTLVLRGDNTTNRIALTFDDGPDRRFTPQVLDVLDKHQVKATFFLMGSRAKAHQDIVKRIHESGHAIGNHTYWHPNLPKEQLDRFHWELTETEKVLANIIGYEPRLFRSPYGALNVEMMDMLSEHDFTVVGWDVDSLDWKQEGAEVIQDNVLSNVGFGSIILMHDGGDWSMDLSGTVEALDQIIIKLKEDGTQFVTIPELFGIPEAK